MSSAMQTLTTGRAPVTLNNLIPEMRAKIIEYLLADPETPDFEATRPARKFPNYFALLFVSKNLHDSMQDVLQRAQDFVLVRSDYEFLPTAMFLHRIPIISDHNLVEDFKHLVATIDITHPQDDPFYGPHISILMRKCDLNELAKLLRLYSLGLLHQQSKPKFFRSDGAFSYNKFPRMSMTIQLKDVSGEDSYDKVRSDIFKSLLAANKIGKIEVLEGNQAAIKGTAVMLQGHTESFRVYNGKEDKGLYFEMALTQWKAQREEDSRTYLELMKWQVELIDIAAERKNMHVKFRRCLLVDQMCLNTLHNNPQAWKAMPNHKEFLEPLVTRVGMARAEGEIYFGRRSDVVYTLAGHRYKPFSIEFPVGSENRARTIVLWGIIKKRNLLDSRGSIIPDSKANWSVKDLDGEEEQERLGRALMA